MVRAAASCRLVRKKDYLGTLPKFAAKKTRPTSQFLSRFHYGFRHIGKKLPGITLLASLGKLGKKVISVYNVARFLALL